MNTDLANIGDDTVLYSEDVAFNEWMEQVDLVVREIAWCSVYDLPDCAFRDMYDDEAEPAEAANVALEAAGFALEVDVL